jgi:hypothetical protein
MMKQNIMACAAALAVGVAGLAISSGEAAAQGATAKIEKRGKICPSDYATKDKDMFCVPYSSNSRKIYHAPDNRKCAGGYEYVHPGWCVEDRKAASAAGSSPSSSTARAAPSGSGGAPSGGRDPGTVGLVLAKSNPLQLCPSGYRTSRDSQRCETIKPEAPAARAKGAGACRADEVEEFGMWCTSTNTTLKAGQIENITIDDFNRIYTQNGRRNPVPAREGYTTPLRSLKEAEERASAPAPAAAVAGNSGGASAQQGAATPAQAAAQADACAAKPKKKGLGRALGGAVGAAIGAVADAAEGC